MPHLVAAPDKFRGTATAAQAAAAAARAALRQGWTADQVPVSDGGEGLLEVVGGEVRTERVSGPLGQSVEAEWHLLGSTAVIEMSRAAGRALMPSTRGDDPVRASTAGVGQLLCTARDAGARCIVVGCGGSATTDGGEGAYDVVGSPEALAGVELVVACDVATSFLEAAAVFGPQKGATGAQVEVLRQRLGRVAARYRRETGVDVTTVPGAGAAGGLAGGLLALGARLEPGFGLVARLTHLAERMTAADLVVTGEGHLDPPSFHGKVPGGVLALALAVAEARGGRGLPVVCIAGGADRAIVDAVPVGMEVISLADRFGRTRARRETLALIEQVTAEVLARFCP